MTLVLQIELFESLVDWHALLLKVCRIKLNPLLHLIEGLLEHISEFCGHALHLTLHLLDLLLLVRNDLVLGPQLLLERGPVRLELPTSEGGATKS